MMHHDEPLAYFITWAVYGTWLQGDIRGWRRFRGGRRPPQPRLADWRQQQLLHPILTLDDGARQIVADEIKFHCQRRQWKLWVANPRSNHVHVVVSARDVAGSQVRDQLKANCTRGLREVDACFRDRPVWTRGGDWQCVNSEDDLSIVIEYAGAAQDRMHHER